MEDFNSFVKNQNSNPKSSDNNLADLVSGIANKYDGATDKELMQAIIREAKKGKENGTLTNADIDNFAAVLSPMLDNVKRAYLRKIVAELKKI